MSFNLLTHRVKERPDIEPVLPLINVVFLLLIFFMLTGKMTRPSEKGITAPKVTSKTKVINYSASKWFYVDKNGRFTYQDEIITDLSRAGLSKKKPLTLFIDGKISGFELNKVLNRFAKLGLNNISIVTERSGGL